MGMPAAGLKKKRKSSSENFMTACVWQASSHSMKIVFVSLLLLSTACLLTAAAVDAKVSFIPHDKIPKNGTIISAPDFSVQMATRYSRGEVEVHDKETDTFHVLEGSATFVTGGTMVGGRVTGAGQQRGKDMTGGQTYHLTKGDVIAIPAGVPHWFKEVPQSISYYVVKVIKP
jgi:mannose-6-phosphate isomerase-like protein (cupin superfamily)